MESLFAYGTLMCDEIMREVAGCLPSRAAGTLKGYSRRAVRGERYPGIVADAAGCVEGVLYRNVPTSAWARLDRFEGEMYARQAVQITLADGETLLAEAYVVRPQFLDRLEQSAWSLADFLREGKASFQQHYTGYRRL